MDAVDRTLEDLADFQPELISPMHCSGHSVVNRIGRTFPESTVLNMVGTRFSLQRGELSGPGASFQGFNKAPSLGG